MIATARPGRDPRPSRGQHAPVRREQQANREPDQDPSDAQLVEERETQHDPERDPASCRPAFESTVEQEGDQNPEKLIEGVHRVDVLRAQIHRGREHARRRQDGGERATTESSGEGRGEEHLPDTGQRRQGS